MPWFIWFIWVSIILGATALVWFAYEYGRVIGLEEQRKLQKEIQHYINLKEKNK